MAQKVQDPVCGMEIDKSKAVTLEKDGKTYYFCSDNCKNKFEKQGGMKTGEMAHEGHEHAGHEMHMGHGGHAGHAGHHAHMVADFRRRFWVSLILTAPVLVLAPMIQELLGLRRKLQFAGDSYVQWAIATVIFFYGGWPFLKGLYDELKKLGYFRAGGMFSFARKYL